MTIPANCGNAIISVRALTKKFGDFTAVDAVSFEIGDKEAFAFLGPNGAGKTTTIKMLITLLAPTGGQALICGQDIVGKASAVRRLIGYVPQMISVDGTLTAYENLKLMAQLYDIPGGEIEGRCHEILEFLKLEDYSHALVRTFSGGMIRKLEVGQAIVHRPRILFLDEPTIGLDPVAKQNIWDHLQELRERSGTTIFFSTHNMEEAEDVADRVAIMNAGKIAAIGTVDELLLKTGRKAADLEEAFIFLTGNKLREGAGFRETRRSRQNQGRLGK
jgi:ABC-2 type transport system ATP-binding protein